MRSPQNFSSVGVHRNRLEYKALGLVSIISPSSELGITHHFFLDSLFLKEYSVKISIFFSTGSTGPQSFCSAIVHKSRFEYGALGLVLIISPSSELGIAYHFFMDSLFFKEYSVKILNFFSTGWQPV